MKESKIKWLNVDADGDTLGITYNPENSYGVLYIGTNPYDAWHLTLENIDDVIHDLEDLRDTLRGA